MPSLASGKQVSLLSRSVKMPVTERLYYNDSHLIEFDARVVDVTERVSGWTAVVLDRTAFYPTGGGQPSDTGTLNGARVVECIDDGDRGVLHVVQGLAPALDTIVSGRIDWLRRLDHMQQHTGQHILSQALINLFNAPTKSFRMLETTCEIDVELASPTTEVIERAIELANNVVWEDRAITIHNVSAEQAAEMPLRKESAREGELRLIEIEGFDLTPCGGTHAFRTGEVGMIALRSWERAKGLTRIEFVAGVRALADYRKANRAAREAAALFSTGRDDVAQNAAQLVEENKELHRRVRALEEVAAGVEAERLWAGVAEETGDGVLSDGTSVVSDGTRGVVLSDGTRVVAHVFDARDGASLTYDAEYLKKLAHALMAKPRTIVLLASRDKDAARLIFARSADASADMSALMREACVLLDGRGGGKPDMAQGGGKNLARLDEAMERAVREVKAV
jgi:alanyl-tRNA synthetase